MGVFRLGFSRKFHAIHTVWMELTSLVLGKVSQAEAESLFVEKIKPLLESKCGGCRGDAGKKIKGEIPGREGRALCRCD